MIATYSYLSVFVDPARPVLQPHQIRHLAKSTRRRSGDRSTYAMATASSPQWVFDPHRKEHYYWDPKQQAYVYQSGRIVSLDTAHTACADKSGVSSSVQPIAPGVARGRIRPDPGMIFQVVLLFLIA